MDSKKFGGLELSENELNMENAVFADGSRIIPKITVTYSKKYIPWRDNGDSNNLDYPIKLLELFNNSSLHHSIIEIKANAVAGMGIEPVDMNDPKATKTIEFLNSLNKNGQDCHETNDRLALDLILFNGISPQIVYQKDWSKIQYVNHLEFHKIRVQTPDRETNEIYGYYWAFDWGEFRPTRMMYIDKYNHETAKLNSKQFKEITDRILQYNEDSDVELLRTLVESGNTQLYYWKKYHPQSFYYPIPEYVALLPTCEIDCLSDIYAESSLKNGMDNGIMITILGDASDKESQASARRILKSYAGARKANKPVIIFTPSFEEAPKIEAIGNSNSLAQKYKLINDSAQQKLVSGHGLPNSQLVGIAMPGKLGATTENASAEEIFFNRYVVPKQKVLENFWNKVMKYNGLTPVRIINNNVFNESKIDTKIAGMPVDKTVPTSVPQQNNQ